MLSYLNPINDDIKIEENLEKIRQKSCDSHKKYQASYFCTNIICVKNSCCFLCEFCYSNHPIDHFNHKEIQYIDDLFSTKRLTQMKADSKLDSSYEDKINKILKYLDQIFEKLKMTLSNIIDEECKKAKAHIQQNFSIECECIMRVFKEHEKVLSDVFTKDEVIDNFNIMINPYLESFNKVSEIFTWHTEIVENCDKNIDLLIKNLPKINQKYRDVADIVQKKIFNFDESYTNINIINPIQSIQSPKSNEIPLQKLKTSKINKNIPKLHTDTIYKIIIYENNTKYITCSSDKTIIIRNCEDNKVIRILTDPKDAVRNILLLSDGRLASSSQNKIIKIWNLTNGSCEQTLIGHSNWVYCLLELPNLMLLSGSFDSSIGVWDISQKDKKELRFYHQIKNDKQSYAYCMTLINVNELAVSSYKDINICSFDNITNKSFNVIKTLIGHNNWVNDIKLLNNSKDLLISCSDDRDCRLWNISQGNCLRVFQGHSRCIASIQILSEKIFVSASVEIIFWNIDSSEAIHSIQPDQSGKIINSLMKNDKNELVFAGSNDFIGLIKI